VFGTTTSIENKEHRVAFSQFIIDLQTSIACLPTLARYLMMVPVERPYLVVTRGGVDLSLEIYLFLEISLLVSSYYSCLLVSEISGVLRWAGPGWVVVLKHSIGHGAVLAGS
jgi:hypothetical protein